MPGGDGAVAGRPHTLDTRSVVSADGSRYSTNETLLADMRVGMAGDNILQSYGSSNDIGGDVESNMRLQLESLQEQMVQTMTPMANVFASLFQQQAAPHPLAQAPRMAIAYAQPQQLVSPTATVQHSFANGPLVPMLQLQSSNAATFQ